MMIAPYTAALPTDQGKRYCHKTQCVHELASTGPDSSACLTLVQEVQFATATDVTRQACDILQPESIKRHGWNPWAEGAKADQHVVVIMCCA